MRFDSSPVRRVAALSGWVAATLVAASAGAAELARPGEYEWTVRTNDEPPRTFTSCMTPEAAKMFNGDSRSAREAAEKASQGRCTIESYEIAGNQVSFRMTCGEQTMASTAIFHGDSSEGDLTVTRNADGVARVDRTHTTARRLGDCK